MTLLLMIICHKVPPAPTLHHMELTPPCCMRQALPCPVLVIPTPLCHWFLPPPSHQHHTHQTQTHWSPDRGYPGYLPRLSGHEQCWPWLLWPGVAVSRQIILLRHNNWIHSAVNRVCDSRKLGFLNSGISIVMDVCLLRHLLVPPPCRKCLLVQG